MKKQRSVKKNIVVLLVAAFFSGTFICKNTSLFQACLSKQKNQVSEEIFNYVSRISIESKKYRTYLAFDFAYEHTNIGPVMLTDNAWVARPWSWIREARYNPSSL